MVPYVVNVINPPFGQLYLIGMWFGVALRPDTKKNLQLVVFNGSEVRVFSLVEVKNPSHKRRVLL
jgi:hypothetical protein